jgi:4'-phosphopantetheinyl transferase
MRSTAFLYSLLPHLVATDLPLDRYRIFLTPGEQRRIDTFFFQRHRNERLVARAMLRKTLSALTGVPPLTWQFRTNKYGRPEIEGPSDYCYLKFSVSHADGLIVCFLSWNRLVGVDVESIKTNDDALNIADQYFATSEVASLRRLPRHEQNRRFLELWTLKESYFKARGCGLSIPLTEAMFEIKKSKVSAIFGAELTDDPARWQFGLRCLGNHLVATSVERQCRSRVAIVRRDAFKLMNFP